MVIVVVAIIIVAGGHQLPKYASRLISLAVLAVVDMLYWISISKSIGKRFKEANRIAYWTPLFLLLVFFIVGIFEPYSQWPALFRIYLPDILLILLIGKGIFLLFMITGDILAMVVKVVKRSRSVHQNTLKRKTNSRPRIIGKVATGMSFGIMLIFLSGMIFWVHDFKLHTVEIKVKDLPEAFDGYKMIQLSDLHLGSFMSARPLNKIVNMVNGQHPDVVLFTGDLVNFTTEEVYPFEKVMKGFSAKDGIFAILGNHDYGEYSQWESAKAKDLNDQELFNFYNRIGWRLLRNQNSIIQKDTASIAIIGVENWSKTKRFGKKGNLQKAMIGIDQSGFSVLMTHDPSHWDGEVTTKYPQIDLTLSGHTHAFQLAVEYGSVKWSPASLLFKQWAGLYEKVSKNGLHQFLYVNRGAGTLGYLGRIATRPEVTLLILRKAK